jgi:chromosome segregation ATPase
MTDIETYRDRIVELEERLRELEKQLEQPTPNDNEVVRTLKEKLKEQKEENRELRKLLFNAKDADQIKRVTFRRVRDACEEVNLKLCKVGKVFEVQFQRADCVIKRQYKKLKQLWDELELADYQNISLMELLKRIFPQYSQANKNEYQRRFKTTTPNQHRPCLYCGCLINWKADPKTFGTGHTRYQPIGLNGNPHNCFTTQESLLNPKLKEVITIA